MCCKYNRFYGNRMQIVYQLVGVLLAAAWAGAWTFVILKVCVPLPPTNPPPHHPTTAHAFALLRSASLCSDVLCCGVL